MIAFQILDIVEYTCDERMYAVDNVVVRTAIHMELSLSRAPL